MTYESGNATLHCLRSLFQRADLNPGWKTIEECSLTKKQNTVARTITKLHKALAKNEPGLPTLRELVFGVYIHMLALEDDSNERISSADALAAVLVDHGQAGDAVSVLDELGEELTKQRGLFFELPLVRTRLRTKMVKLRDIPEFYPDLCELDAQSLRTVKAFRDNHRDQLDCRYTLPRPIANEVLARIATGNLLVVGEPGAGKTGVLMP